MHAARSTTQRAAVCRCHVGCRPSAHSECITNTHCGANEVYIHLVSQHIDTPEGDVYFLPAFFFPGVTYTPQRPTTYTQRGAHSPAQHSTGKGARAAAAAAAAAAAQQQLSQKTQQKQQWQQHDRKQTFRCCERLQPKPDHHGVRGPREGTCCRMYTPGGRDCLGGPLEAL